MRDTQWSTRPVRRDQEKAEAARNRRLELAVVADPSLDKEAREMLAAKLAGRPYVPPTRKRRK